MNKEKENKKLEIILPLEIAEKLYQAILHLISMFNLNTSNDEENGLVEESLLENFLEKRIKEEGIGENRASQERVMKLSAKVKNMVTKDVEAALEKLKSSLVLNSKTNNDVINLLSRHNRIIKGLNNGVIGFQIADNEVNKIVNALLLIVDNLDEESLK